jgi:hypothetical protein
VLVGCALLPGGAALSRAADAPATQPAGGFGRRERPVDERRFFVVDFDGRRVGYAVALLGEHYDKVKVDRIERYLFRDDGAPFGYAYREQTKTTEVMGTWPAAITVHVRDRQRAGSLWMQGRKGPARFRRNWLGRPTGETQISIPEGYNLFRWVAAQAQRAAQKGSRFQLRILNWHGAKPVWTTRLFEYVGPDAVKTAKGRTVEAKRFRYWDREQPRFAVTLWTDENGLPVAKEVPFLKLRYIACDAATANDHDEEMTWDEAKKRWKLDDDGWLMEDLFRAVGGEGLGRPPAETQPGKPGFPENVLIDLGL